MKRARVTPAQDTALRQFWGGKVCVFDTTQRLHVGATTAHWHHLNSDRSDTVFQNIVPLSCARNEEAELLRLDPSLQSQTGLSYHDIHATGAKHRQQGNYLCAYGCYRVGSYVHKRHISRRIEFALLSLEVLIHAPDIPRRQNFSEDTKANFRLNYPVSKNVADCEPGWLHLATEVLRSDVIVAMRSKKFSRDLSLDERRRWVFKACIDISDHWKLSGNYDAAIDWCRKAIRVRPTGGGNKDQLGRLLYHVAEIYGGIWNLLEAHSRNGITNWSRRQIKLADKLIRPSSKRMHGLVRPPVALQVSATYIADGNVTRARQILDQVKADIKRDRTAKANAELFELGASHGASCDVHEALIVLASITGLLDTFFGAKSGSDLLRILAKDSPYTAATKEATNLALGLVQRGYDTYRRCALHGVWAGPYATEVMLQFEKLFVPHHYRIQWRCHCRLERSGFKVQANRISRILWNYEEQKGKSTLSMARRGNEVDVLGLFEFMPSKYRGRRSMCGEARCPGYLRS